MLAVGKHGRALLAAPPRRRRAQPSHRPPGAWRADAACAPVDLGTRACCSLRSKRSRSGGDRSSASRSATYAALCVRAAPTACSTRDCGQRDRRPPDGRCSPQSRVASPRRRSRGGRRMQRADDGSGWLAGAGWARTSLLLAPRQERAPGAVALPRGGALMQVTTCMAARLRAHRPACASRSDADVPAPANQEAVERVAPPPDMRRAMAASASQRSMSRGCRGEQRREPHEPRVEHLRRAVCPADCGDDVPASLRETRGV